MPTRRAVHDRDAEEAEILDALLERGEEGMTVLELRASVDADIDAIEEGLTELKESGLIDVERESDTHLIRPDESVMPEPDEPAEDGLREAFEAIRDAIREWLSF